MSRLIYCYNVMIHTRRAGFMNDPVFWRVQGGSRMPLKPMLGGGRIVAPSIGSHEQPQ